MSNDILNINSFFDNKEKSKNNFEIKRLLNILITVGRFTEQYLNYYSFINFWI